MGTIFLLWLSVMPLIMLYGAYEGPKIFWLWGGGFFLTIWWFLRILKGNQFKSSKETRVYILWLAVLAIASVFGIHPAESFIGGSYRHQGVLFFFTLFLIFQTKELLPQKLKGLLLKWIAIPLIFESVIVLVGKIVSHQVRPLGTFGEPNAIAGYLAIGLYWVWNMSKMPSWVRYLSCLCVISAILATGSRTGIVSAIIVIAGNIWSDFREINHKNYTNIIIGSGVAIAVAICGFTVWQVFQTRSYSPYENRQLFWGLAMGEIAQRPLLGFGAESGEHVFDLAFAAKEIRVFDTMVDRTHSIFLDVLMWSGIVGLGVFLYWIGLIFCRFYRARDWGRISVFVAWFMFASFQPVGVVHWVCLMILL
jgi:O-antigen ligase